MGADEALKPALSRGDIAVIGATTPEEYRDDDRRGRGARPALHDGRRHASSTATPRRPILRERPRRAGEEPRRDRVSDDAHRRAARLRRRARSPIGASRTRRSTCSSRRSPTRSWPAQTDGRPGRRRRGHDRALGARASSTPTLDRFGRDLVGLAREGKLGPIVGRDRETRRDHRGPAAAARSATRCCSARPARARRPSSRASPSGSPTGAVPEALRDIHIFDVPLLALAAGDRRRAVRCSADFLVGGAPPVGRRVLRRDPPARLRAGARTSPSRSSRRWRAATSPASAPPPARSTRRTSSRRRRSRAASPQIPIEPMDAGGGPQPCCVAVRDEPREAARRPGHGRCARRAHRAGRPVPAQPVLPGQGRRRHRAVGRLRADPRRDDGRRRRGARGGGGDGRHAARSGRRRWPHLAAALTQAARCSTPTRSTALLGRLGVSLRGLDARRERPDAVVLLCGAARRDRGRARRHDRQRRSSAARRRSSTSTCPA